jgi:2-methylisocitrate lyase-like PEP mutase family enzyme
LVLFNIWDAGSAVAVTGAGARALATGSWSVAAAMGFEDGEKVPRDLAIANLERIARSVDLPVTVDLEGAYAGPPGIAAETASLAIEAGAVGCNFEDSVVGNEEIHPVERQRECIAAMRDAAERKSIPLFINARIDCFLLNDRANHHLHLEAALDRAHAYADAGASGIFLPGLVDETLIARACAGIPLPVNILAIPGAPAARSLARLGVARISYGAAPYRHLMHVLHEAAQKAFDI